MNPIRISAWTGAIIGAILGSIGPTEPSPAPAAAPAVTVVCLGDSVTKGVRPGVKPQETFTALLEAGLREQGLRVKCLNAGIGGNRTDQGLARLEKDVLAHKPALVTIMFGLNDSWIDADRTEPRLAVDAYRQNLTQIVRRVRQAGAVPLVMTSNPAIAPQYPPERNANLQRYINAARQVARKERAPLVDLYQRFAELAIGGRDLNELFTDAMHPNPRGHRLIANMLLPRVAAQLKKRAAAGEPSAP